MNGWEHRKLRDVDADFAQHLRDTYRDYKAAAAAMWRGQHWMAYLNLPLPATNIQALIAEILQEGRT